MKLIEILATSGNIHQLANASEKSLVDTDQYQDLKKSEPRFADTLLQAWRDDANDFKKNPKTFDPLSPKILTIEYFKKVTKSSFVSPNQSKDLDMLKSLFSASFSKAVTRTQDKSAWSHVEKIREGKKNGHI